jgi:formylglycine-generating enzyme
MRLRTPNPVFFTASVVFLAATATRAITIETVPVGNPGNVGELSGGGAGGRGHDAIVGAVDYEYNIGKYEVTCAQYVEFLNAVAATDTYGLYNTLMSWDDWGCKIQRTGSSGNFAYSVAPDRADRPVNYVSWYDAARFCNWLTTGDTETGVYTFTHGSPTNILDHETAAETLGATAWFIPTEDEWYKAAYHKNDGVTGNYWDWPTATDTFPSNDLIDPDPGNNASFHMGGGDYTIGGPYYATEVGEFENSASPYGTFDQGGNLSEWTETNIDSFLGVRGGSWGGNYYDLLASHRNNSVNPTIGRSNGGFRVACIPEPGSITLFVCGLVGGLVFRRRWKYSSSSSR